MAVEPQIEIVDSLRIGDLRFEEVKGTAGCRMPWHDHTETYIDLYLSGVAKASWHPSVHAFTVSTIRAGERHKSTSLTGIHTFQLVIPESWIAELSSPVRQGIWTCEAGRLAQLALLMHRSFTHRDDITPIDLEGLLYEYWSFVSIRPTGSDWLKQVRDYIQDHYAQSISASSLGRAVGIHPAHLMREFRRVHRCTVGDAIRAVRIERACGLLKSSTLTLAEVAYAVGFADQSHFNRTFRNLLGVTPTAYRQAVCEHRRES